MAYYRSVGEVPRKRHAQLRGADGQLRTEELVGEDGFFAASSLLYHRHLPNVLVSAEVVDVPALTAPSAPNLPLLPRKFDTHLLSSGGETVTGRHTVVANDDVRVSWVQPDRPGPLFRNAVGDELVFVEAGAATLESVYGRLDASQGDYVRVPMGCIHRWVPATGEALRLLIIEATGHVGLPARYLSPRGQLLEHAPYSERDFRGPTELLEVDDGEVDVLVRHHDGVTRHTYAHHPFDVVGWDGCVYPYAFSIHDFEPIVKRFHAPPPVHETFTAGRFVVCSFCPRPADFDPTAVPAPYSHTAVDCDEVMFIVSGDYTARADAGVGPGSMTFHPAGFTHGPQPGGVEAALGKTWNDEYAVMIDTFAPLGLGAAAPHCEDADYHRSWQTRTGAR
ncbi:MAG: homogentisate 12-dioxygenase [Actinomycetia bacterium]|nr:homogentisate 12-dioxygenase [Actinomycetes bacterium]